MSTCPQCGATLPEGEVHCSDCGEAVSNGSKPESNGQTTATQESTDLTNVQSRDLSQRLEKAMRRNELLTYAAAGLGFALLAVIIIISLL